VLFNAVCAQVHPVGKDLRARPVAREDQEALAQLVARDSVSLAFQVALEDQAFQAHLARQAQWVRADLLALLEHPEACFQVRIVHVTLFCRR